MYGRFMLAAVTAIAVFGVDDAFAQNTKSYGGSQCFLLSGSLFFVTNGTIANGSAGNVLVDCGAVKEGSLSISSGNVRVLDRHSTQNVECDLHSVVAGVSSLSINTHGPLSSAQSSANFQNLSFGPVTSLANGHYYYICQIPPISGGNTSQIATYLITES